MAHEHMQSGLSEHEATDIAARENALRQWLGKRCSYKPEELPAEINPPTNDERSMLEVFNFCRDKPDRYFLYIDEKRDVLGYWSATTWTGEKLGRVYDGKVWSDNFGGKRVSIRIDAINGCSYSGTYYKSSGSYARIRKTKRG